MDSPLQLALVALLAASTLAWLGTTAVLQVACSRARTRGDFDASLALSARWGRITQLVTTPAAVVALVAGILLVREVGGLSLEQDWWIGASAGLWIVAFLGATLLRAAECRRAVKLSGTQEEGAASEEVRWHLRRVLLLSRGELLLLVVAIVLLVVQPA